MSELPRHRRRARTARHYVAAPVAAAVLAGLVAIPAILPSDGDDLVVRMDDARKAATAAGKAASSALRPATVDPDTGSPAANAPVPVPVAATPANESTPGTPTSTQEAPKDPEPSTETTTSKTPRQTAADRSSAPSTSSPSRSSQNSSPASTTSAAAATSAPEQSTTQPSRATQSSSGENAAEREVLDIVNAERAAAGCGPVAHDSGLAALAGDYSADMAERGFFSHTDPDGKDPWDRARDAGIDYLRAENIARGQPTPAAVMESWMDSAGHRRNILNCEYTKLGVGAHFASGGPWWTQSFGV